MFKKTKVCSGLMLAFGGTLALGSLPAFAQQQLQKVEITGSSIKRIDTETALPVTVIKREDIERTGATTVADLLEKVTSNNGAGYNVAAALGDAARPGFSGASLRALGSNNTLVLMNGRRLSVYAFDGGAVSLNDIPLDAIERIEILRDGASSTYGTDAIAGVINLITRKDFKGGVVQANYTRPVKTGGTSKDVAATLGLGDLTADKFNVMLNLSHLDLEAIKAADRKFASTAFRPDLGVNRLSSNAFPANISVPGVGLRSPGANAYNGGAGCAPPKSFGTSAGDTRCRFDYASVIDIVPESTRNSLFLRGVALLPGDNQVAAEFAHAKNKYVFRISPTPASEATTFAGDPLVLPITSPFYPKAWVDANFAAQLKPGGVYQPLNIYYRGLEAGPRTNQVDSTQQRLVLSADGRIGSWDYGVGLMNATSKATESYIDGYLLESKLLPAFATGLINPFGFNNAAGLAALNATRFVGDTRIAKSTLTIGDAKVSGEVMQLPAGALAIALGLEGRKEKYDDNPLPVLNTGDIIGGAGSQLPVVSARTIKAVFAEASIPVTKEIEIPLSIRFDKYSDFGNTTNPKAAIRWKLSNSLLLRGSVGTGFRAPTLPDLFAPQTQTNTGGAYNDPLYDNIGNAGGAAGYSLCDGGAGGPATPIFSGKYCNAQLTVKQSGNSGLTPEKSRQFTVGMVFEPTKDISVTADFFQITQRDLIGFVTADTRLVDYVNNFNPATNTSTSQYSTDVFTKFDPAAGAAGGTVIDFIRARFENLGQQRTSGVDVSMKFRLPPTEVGNFRVNWDLAYIISQKVKDVGAADFGPSFVGEYARNGATLRLKHRAELLWERGGWEATGAMNWQSGYVDQNPAPVTGGKARVRAHETFDTTISYTGIKNLKLKFGILNLLDLDPARSNQNDYFQVGYDAANSDPRGRTFSFGAQYKF